MTWIEHLEAAAKHFEDEAKKYRDAGDTAYETAANNDAAAIRKLIDDIENGETQIPK